MAARSSKQSAKFLSVLAENMKQKIIIKVSMHCSKCRTKALKIAAVADGVISVALHGPDEDKLMIVGDGVDAACLTSCLRKKLCHASIEIVEVVIEKKPEPKPTPPPPPPCKPCKPCEPCEPCEPCKPCKPCEPCEPCKPCKRCTIPPPPPCTPCTMPPPSPPPCTIM